MGSRFTLALTSSVVRGTLLAGVAILATGTAQAADVTLGHATVSLENFKYRLIDLQPDDGIPPSITFKNGSAVDFYTSGALSGANAHKASPGGLNSGAIDSLTNGSGNAGVQRSGDNYSVRSEIRLSDVATLPRGGQPKVSSTAFAQLASLTIPDLQWNFTLSPHTALVLEGVAKTEADLNLAPLLTDPLLSGPNRAFDKVQASFVGEASMILWDDKWQVKGSLAPGGLASGVDQEASAASLKALASSRDPFPANVPFSLRYDNTGDQSAGGVLKVTMSSWAQVSAVPVPEPENWAMAVSGLAVAGLSVRRRQREAG